MERATHLWGEDVASFFSSNKQKLLNLTTVQTASLDTCWSLQGIPLQAPGYISDGPHNLKSSS